MLNPFSKQLWLLVFSLLLGLEMSAQRGTIRGKVLDGETGEPLFAANAVLKGTTNGATTDFDGFFEITAEPGTYDLNITFIGMSGTTITGVVVKGGEVTAVGDVVLKPASNELEAVTVTAEAVRNTEAAILTVKRKSANLIDGISSAKLQKIGDSDAGDAAKRVTGVSVEGGKYVYVRGLGDRYTKTMLNGVDIPGLDPDRNAIQIDIFPTNLISNMTILKTGLAELPADFAGGLVNIETKEFPTDKILKVSASVGYNPAMHFNNNYISYEGSGTDFLGFDGGTRSLPNNADQDPIPSPLSTGQYTPDQVNDFLNDFSPVLGAENSTSMMDFSLGLSSGNQYTLDNGNKLGYIFSGTYRNETDFFDNVTYGEYVRPAAADEYELIYTTIQEGQLAQRNVLLGGLGGLTYKTLNSKYRLTVMHLQSGESRTSQFRLDNSEVGGATGQSGYRAFVNNLEYFQRGLTNVLFNGEHHTQDGKWDVEWKLSPTFSNIKDPDLRRTPFTINAAQGDSSFEAGQGGNQKRIWRYLNEVNFVSKLDVVRNLEVYERDAKLKFGASNIIKYRDYEILDYDLQYFGSQPDFSGDPNEVLDPNLLYPNGPIYYQAQFGNPNPNAYQSNNNNFAAYSSFEFSPTYRLKAIFGLRMESFVQRHTGRSALAAVAIRNGADPADLDEALDNEVVLNSVDFFPSANLIYSLNENMNLRGSYFRSIARPSFKELSFAQILDPASNRTFNGGLFAYNPIWDGNLTETRINNIDLRWELFMKPGEIISVSTFFKTFDNPIELVRIPEAQTTPEFQPRNVGDGLVYGAEFELTKGLDFLGSAFDQLSFSGNFTYVYSQIDMNATEFEARDRFEKLGETVENTRQMQGQAPYVVNAGLIYDDLEKGLNFGAFYNVKGRTLEVVGGGLFPDVYTEPFHSLNLTANYGFGVDRNQNISVKVANLLLDVRESFFVGFEAQDQIFTQFEPGIQFSISYSYDF
jgi:outer membrane receptor protein involved in Fe transport